MALPIAGIMNLRQRAAAGDPQAAAELQAVMQEMQGMQGPPAGQMPPPGAAGPAGPQGAPPPQMSQSQFGNGGAPISPDVQAARAQQLIQILRARGGQ